VVVASAPSCGTSVGVGVAGVTEAVVEGAGVAVVDVVVDEEVTVDEDVDVAVAVSVVVVVVGDKVEVVVEVVGGSFREAPIASVQVLTSCTTSWPCASLTWVKTKTHVTVTGPNGVSVV